MVCHHAEVGYDVLDFLALIERQSTVNAIRNTILAHLFLEAAALCIGAIQNGEIRIFALFLPADTTDVVTHNHRFLLVAIGRFERESLALFVLAEHILVNLAGVLANQTVCRLHDKLRRTIVLLQFEELRIGILLLKIQDIVDVGTTEAIDALCVVAHHTDTTSLLCQLQHDFLLSEVRILVLVDQDVLETLYVFLAYILMVLEQQPRLHQQVVEVHRIGLTTTLHVPIIYIGDLGALLLSIVCRPRTDLILLWQQQVVLRHRDAVSHRSGLIHLLVELQLLDDVLHQRT